MSERAKDSARVLENADKLVTREQLSEIYDRLADQISQQLAGKDPLILCVMIGGSVPAVEIIQRLDFPFEFDYLHATRYRGDTAGGELIWKVSPGTPVADRDVLVIDDILDEGPTLAAILNALQAQGPASVLSTVLVEKQHGRKDPAVKPDFVGVELEDRYLFGCGMDYRGYLRQYPEIYAVADGHNQDA